MNRSFTCLAVVCFLFVLVPRSAAQEALVLSGGGSRGLAHVGVLLGLEEFGYDPDIVVGTSMGAVVGALYAAGYSPAQITEHIHAIDWARIYETTPLILGPDRDPRYPLINFDLTLDEFRFVRGLIPQWRINRVLSTLLFDANARARGDFDRLARRYRAVAADLRTGDRVVLSSGDLARAARASMAVPGIFAPVVWDGRVLLDGGIVDNVPTGLARAMGATRIIVSDVGRPSEEVFDQSPFGLIDRAIDLMQENTQRDPIPPDVLVVPRIDAGFGATLFPSDPTRILEIGLEAARRDLSPAPPSDRRQPRRRPEPPDSLSILRVEAPDTGTAMLARFVFADIVPGPYDPAAVTAAMDRLYGSGLFEAVWARVADDPSTARSTLVVRLETPPQTSLTAGAGYDNDRGARAWASLVRQSSRFPRPTLLAASASIDGVDRWAAVSTRVTMLHRTGLFWSAGLHLRERDVRSFPEDAVASTDVVRTGGWLALELPQILRDRLITAAVRGEWITVEEGDRGFSYGPAVHLAQLGPEAMIVGEPFLVEVEHRFGALSYSRAALRGSRPYPLEPLLLAVVGDLVWSSSGAPGDVRPALGDSHAMPGMRWGEDRGGVRALMGADAAYPVLGGHLRLRLRTGAVAERLGRLDDSDFITGAQLAAVWRTPLGLAEVGFGANTGGSRRFEVGIGRTF